MIKICLHCGNEFECKEDDIINCDCLSVTLSAETLAYIASQFEECLCLRCLRNFEETAKGRTY